MPTYQYACTACGHQLEAVQSFADEPLTECPACEGRLRKLFSSVGVVFKGSGFYRNDSRTGPSSGSSSDPSSGEAAKPKDSASKDSATPAKESSTTTTPAASKKEAAASPAS